MNNYAVSSGELGEILKKASAPLAVSGDSMEQVVAMGAAMNAIIQDASVVGSTLKVVGMRIRGATSELEEAGEATDGMAISTSKLRGEIMALTKGSDLGAFDIMKDANTFKTTYDIIDGIAARWDDIAQVDQAALLELLAGKNRSSGLASLLGNWDDAKLAYEDAQNAQGSAMKENERYIESVQGHIAQLTNEIQKFAFITIETDWLKDLIDLGTGFLKIINSILDKTGALQTILASVAGVVLSVKKEGFVDFSDGGFGLGGLGEAIKNLLTGEKPDIRASIQDSILQTLGASGKDDDSAKEIIESLWGGIDEFKSKLSTTSQNNLKPIWEDIENGQAKVHDVLEVSLGEVETFGTKFKGVMGGVLSAVGNMFVMYILEIGVSALFKLVKYIAETKERAIEQGKQAQDDITEIMDNIKEKADSVEELAISINVKDADTNTLEENLDQIAERYSELVTGVNKFTNANKSLSSEEYQEYLDISNALAEQYPALIKAYDEQGNKILKIGTSAEECKQSLQDMYDVSLKLSNIDIGNNLDTLIDGALLEIEDFVKKLNSVNAEIAKLGDERSSIEETRIDNNFEIEDDKILIRGYSHDRIDILNSVLKNNNVPFTVDYNYTAPFSNDHNGYVYAPSFTNLSQAEQENIYRQYMETIGPVIEDEIANLNVETGEAVNKKITLDAQIKDRYDTITKNIVNYLNSSGSFNELNENIKAAVIANFNFDDVQAEILENEYDGSSIDYIYGEIISKLNNPDIDFEKFNLIDNILSKGIGNISDKNYQFVKDEIKSLFDQTFGNESDNMLDMLGFSSIFTDYESQINAIRNRLKKGMTLTKEDNDIIQNLSPKEIQTAFSVTEKTVFKSMKAFQLALNEKIKDFDNPLSALFSSENFINSEEKIKNQLSALTSAYTSALENGGNVIGEAALELQKSFPDSEFDFNLEGLSGEGVNQLGKWIDTLNDQAKAMKLSEDAMSGLNQYIMSLIVSYDELITASNLVNSISENLLTSSSAYHHEIVKEFKEDIEKEFENELGEEEGRQILYYLQLDPESATWTVDEWREKYDNTALNWTINISSKFQEDLERAKAEAEAAATDTAYQEVIIDTKESFGNYDTIAEIDAIIKNNQTQIDDLNKQLEILHDINNPESFEYKEANSKFWNKDEYEDAKRAQKEQDIKLKTDRQNIFNENRYLEDSKLLVPFNIEINSETTKALKEAYDDSLKELQEYGENTSIDNNIYDTFFERSAEQLNSNENLLAMLENILSIEDLDNKFREEVEGQKETIESEIAGIKESVQTYSQKYALGAEDFEITKIKGQKSVRQALMNALDLEMTPEDYAVLNEFNESLVEAYDSAIVISNEKMNELAPDGIIAKLSAEEQNEYQYYLGRFQEFVSERAEILSEMSTNQATIDIFPMTTLEKQLESVEGTYSTLKGMIDDIEARGEQLVSDKTYSTAIGVLDRRYDLVSQLARGYSSAARNLPEGSQLKTDYEQKARGYYQQLSGIKQESDAYLEKIDVKSIEYLQLQAQRANDTTQDLVTTLENLKRPLTENDYQGILESIGTELEYNAKMEEYWQKKRDTSGLDKSSQKYQEYDSNLKSVQNTIISLTKTQEEYNKAMRDIPFDEINREVENLKAEEATLELEVNLKIAQGGIKTSEDFDRQLEDIRGRVQEAVSGQEEATSQMSEIMPLPGVNAPMTTSSDVLNQLSGEDPLLAVEEADINRFKELSEIRRGYYNDELSARTEFIQVSEEKEELALHEIEANLDESTRAYENAQKILEDSSHKMTEQDYQALYDAAGENIEDMQAEYDFYVARAMEAEQSENFDPMNADYLALKTTIATLGVTIDDTKEKQQEWYKLMQDLDLTDALYMLERFDSQLEELQNEVSLNEAKGIKKTLEDYEIEDATLRAISEEAKAKAEEVRAELDEKLYNGSITAGSVDEEEYRTKISNLDSRANQADIQLANNSWEEELYDINELKEELSELEVIGGQIEERIQAAKDSGEDMSEADYQVLSKNLDDRKEKLQSIRDLYVDLYWEHTDDTFGQEILTGLAEVDSQMKQLNKNQIDINTEFDMQPLNNLKEQLGYLDKQAEELSKALNDDSLSTDSKAEKMTELISINRERLSNLRKEAEEYEELMAQLKKEHPKDYLLNDDFIQAATGLSEVNSIMVDLTGSIEDMSIQLQNLPVEKLEKIIEFNESLLALNSSKRDYIQSSGQKLTSDDYTEDIATAQDSSQQAFQIYLEKQKETAKARGQKSYDETLLKSGKTTKTYHGEEVKINLDDDQVAIDDAIRQENEALSAFYQAVVKARSLSKEATEADLAVYDELISLLESEQGVAESERKILEGRGETRGEKEIQEDMSFAQQRISIDRQKMQFYTEHQKELGYSDADLKTLLDSIQAGINEKVFTIEQLAIEQEEFPMVSVKANIEELQGLRESIDNEFKKYDGVQVPVDLVDAKLTNIDLEKEDQETVRDFYQGLVDKWQPILGDEFVNGWKQTVQEAKNTITDLEDLADQTTNLIDEQVFANYEGHLNTLSRDYQDLKEIIEDTNLAPSKQVYQAAISKASEQLPDLYTQRDMVLADMKEKGFLDAQGNINENYEFEGVKMDVEGLPEFQELNDQLIGFNDSIKTLMDDMILYGEELSKMSYDSAVTAADELAAHVTDRVNKQQQAVSEDGYIMTEADYERNLKDYQSVADMYQGLAQFTARQMDDLDRIGAKGSDAYKELLTAFEGYTGEYEEWTDKIRSDETLSGLLETENLKQELAELQDTYSTLQSELTVKSEGEHYRLTEDDYATSFENLYQQEDVVKKLLGIYSQKALDFAGTSIGKQAEADAREMKRQLDDIFVTKEKLKVGIDDTALQNLKTDMQLIESDSSALKTKLENTFSYDGKYGVLTDLINKNEEGLDNLESQKKEVESQILDVRKEVTKDVFTDLKPGESFSKNLQEALDNNELWKSLHVQLAGIIADTVTLTDETQVYLDQLSDLDKVKLEGFSANNASIIESEQNRRRIKETKGEIITDDDYTRELALRQSNMNIAEQLYNDANKKYNDLMASYNENPYAEDAEELLGEIAVAKADLAVKEGEYTTAQIDYFDAKKEADDAALNETRDNIDRMEETSRMLKSAQRVTEAMGKETTKADLYDNMAISRNIKNELEQQLRDFDEKHGINTETGEGIGNLDIQDLQTRNSILESINSEYEEVLSNHKLLLENDSKAHYDGLEELEDNITSIDTAIAELDRQGKEIPEYLYDVKLINLEDKKEELLWIKNFYQDLIDKYPLLSTFVKEWGENVDDANAQLIALGQEVDEIQTQITNKPLETNENRIAILDSEAQYLQAQYDNLKYADMTEQEILEKQRLNAIQNQAIYFNEMKFYEEQLAKLSAQGATYLNNSKFREAKDALDTVRLSFNSAVISAKEFTQAINDIPLNRFRVDLEEISTRKDFAESKNSIREALGGFINYDEIIKADVDTVSISQGIVNEAFDKMQSALDEWKANETGKNAQALKDAYDAAAKEYVEALSSLNSAKVTEITDRLAQAKQPIEILDEEMTKIQNSATDVTNSIDMLTEMGLSGTAEQYRQLIQYNEEQANTITKQIEMWEAYKQFGMYLVENNELSMSEFQSFINEVDSSISSLKQNMLELQSGSLDYQMMINGGIKLDQLSKEFKKISAENSTIMDSISTLENRNVAITAALYEKASDNISAQIENLKASNMVLSEQQETIGITASKFNELESSIRDNNSTIMSLLDSLYDYSQKVINYIYNASQAMSNAVNTVLSESESDSGVTTESMNVLIGQFSSLEEVLNIDISSLFYYSSEGIKMNVTAFTDLLNIQRKVYSGSILNAIKKQNQAIRNSVPAINSMGRAERNEAKQTLEGYRAKLRAMNKQLVGYSTIMDAIQETESRYRKWKEAEETENEGDRLEEYANAAPTYEEERNKGHIGTDEFKAYTSLGNYWGDTSARAYDLMYNTLLGLLYPEGGDMVTAFMNKLVSTGFASIDGRGHYIADALDTDAIAQSWGISVELVDMLIGEARDYGAIITTVKNQEDGILQAQETRAKLMEEYQKYAEKIVKNAGPEWIDVSEDEINILLKQLYDINTITKSFEGAELFSREDYETQKKYVELLFGFAKQFWDEGDMIGYAQVSDEIDRVAKEYGFKIAEDIKSGFDTSFSNSYEDSLKYAEEYMNALSEYIPDLYDVLAKDDASGEYLISSYKSAIERLQDIADEENIKIDFSFNPQKVEELSDEFGNLINGSDITQLQEHLQSLEDLKLTIDSTTDPAAYNTLEKLIEMDTNEIRLRFVLQSAEDNGESLTLQQLATMATEDEEKAINLVMNLSDNLSEEDAQAILNLAKNKALEIPMNVTIDQSSIDSLVQSLIDAYERSTEQAVKEIADETSSQIEQNADEQYNNKLSGPVVSSLELDFSSAEAETDNYLEYVSSVITEETAETIKNRLMEKLSDYFKEVFDLGKLNINVSNDEVKEKINSFVTEILTEEISAAFGNIDMSNREQFNWTKENIARNQQYASINGIKEGDVSTTLGSWQQYQDYGIAVAFSPLLQTGTGTPELLNQDTIDKYIHSLLEDSSQEIIVDDKISFAINENTLLELDKQGRQVGDKFIQGIIAGMDTENIEPGNKADIISQLMRYTDPNMITSMNFEPFINSMIQSDDIKEITTEATTDMSKLEAVAIGLDTQIRNLANSIETSVDKLTQIIVYLGMLPGKIENAKDNLNTDITYNALLNTDGLSEDIDQKITNIIPEIKLGLDGLIEPKDVLVNFKADINKLDEDIKNADLSSPIVKVKANTNEMVENVQQESQNIEENITPVVTVEVTTDKPDLEIVDSSVNISVNTDTDNMVQDVIEESRNIEENINPTIGIKGNATSALEIAKSTAEEINNKVRPIIIEDGNTEPLINTTNIAKKEIEKPVTIPILPGLVPLFNSLTDFFAKNVFNVQVKANVQVNTTTTSSNNGSVSTPITFTAAHGTNGPIDKDRDSLVNEVLVGGQKEGLIRDGVLTEIPGGMHIEHLKKGDVIVNSRQMTQLKKYGKASGQAKIQGGYQALVQGNLDDGVMKFSGYKEDDPLASFAHGNLNGMIALPQGSYDALGTLDYRINTSDYSGFTDRWNEQIDDSVDSLDDFNDAVNDSTNSINHSKQTIDYIQKALSYFADKTTKITDKITDYVDSATKRILYSKELEAIENEIYANSKAAVIYYRDAYKNSYNHEYYDDNGNKHYLNLGSELNLNELINGTYKISDIDTSTAHGQALYDAASEFMSMIENSRSASSSIQELTNRLKEVYEAAINLTFDDLAESLGKLEMKMQSLDSFASTASSGQSGISLLEKTLQQVFGDKSKEMFNSFGKTYEVLNREIEENIKLQAQKIGKTRFAINEAEANVSNLEQDYALVLEQLDNAMRKLMSSGNLTNEEYQAVINREIILGEIYNGDPTNLADYNQLAARAEALKISIKNAREKIDENINDLEQQTASYVSALISSVSTRLENINNYYSSYIDRQSSIIGAIESNLSYIEKLSKHFDEGVYFESYADIITRYNDQLDNLAANIREQEASLAESVNNGLIKIDSEEFRTHQNSINSLKVEYINLMKASLDTYDAMMEVPVLAMNEKIESITTSFRGLNSVMASNIEASGSMIRMIQDINQRSALGDIGQFNFGKYVNDEDFVKEFKTQNAVIAENALQQQAIMRERYETMIAQQKIYNEAILESGKSSDIAKREREKLEESQADYLEQQANAVKAQVEAAKSMIANIKNYYDSICNYYDTLASRAASERSTLEKWAEASGSYPTEKILETYQKELQFYSESKKNVLTSVQTMRAQLQYAIDNGDIAVDSTEYREIMLDIIGLENEAVSLRDKQQDLYIQMLQIPDKEITRRLDNITKSYITLNTALSTNILDTSAGQRFYSRLTDQFNSLITEGYDINKLIDESIIEINGYQPKDIFPVLDDVEPVSEEINISPVLENFDSVYEEIDEIGNKFADALVGMSMQIKGTGYGDILFEDEGIGYGDILFEDEGIGYGDILFEDELEPAVRIDEGVLQDTEGIFENIGAEIAGIREELETGAIAEAADELAIQDSVSDSWHDISQSIEDTNIVLTKLNMTADKTKLLFTDLGLDYMHSYYNGPTYIGQNEALVDNIKQMQKTVGANIQTMLTYRDMLAEATTEEEYEAIKTKYVEATETARESVAKLAKMEASALGDMIKNIETYYSRITGLVDSVNNIFKSTRDYMVQSSGYIKNYANMEDSYGVSVEQTQYRLSKMQNELSVIQAQTQEALANGKITTTDDEYIDAMVRINSLQNDIIGTTSSLQTLYEEMYNLPNEVAVEKINDITKAFQNMTIAMSNSNYETISTQRALYEIAKEYNTNPFVNAEQFNFAIGETFVGQNASLLLDLKRMKQELDVYSEAMIKTNDNLNNVKEKVNNPTFVTETQSYSVYVPGYNIIEKDNLNDAINTDIIYNKTDFPMSTFEELEEAEEEIAKFGDNLESDFARIIDLENSVIEWDSISEVPFGEMGDIEWDSISEVEESSKYVEGSIKQVTNTITRAIEVTQEEINAAQNAFDASVKTFVEKQTEYARKTVEYAKQSIININSYYNTYISYQDALVQRLESNISVLNQVGKTFDEYGNLITNIDVITENYNSRIDEMRDKQKYLAKSIVEQEYQMEQVKDIIGEDSEEYREMTSTLLSLKDQFDSTTVSIDALQDQMREELYFKPIQDAITQLQNLKDNFESINNLISEEAKLTDKGEYTEMGVLSLSFDMNAYNVSRDELEKAIEQYKVMNERWKKDESYSDEQYLADRQTAISSIQKAMQNVNSGQQAVLTAIKNRYRTEIDYIKELIQKQSEELSKKKELADYEKSLKEKTNSVKQIEMQIRALEQLTDIESKAKKVRLEEQLKQSKDDLNDTVQNHIIELRQDALSDLSTKLDEKYDEYVKNLEINFIDAKDTVIKMENNILTYLDQADNTLNSFLDTYSKNVTTEMATGFANIGIYSHDSINEINALESDLNLRAEEINSNLVNIFDLRTEDFRWTQEMEEEKAQKLQDYNNARNNAISTLKEDIIKREKAIEQLLSTYKDDKKISDETEISTLESILAKNNELLKASRDISNNLVDKTSDSVVHMIEIARDAITDAVNSYNKEDNAIRNSVLQTKDNINKIIKLIEGEEGNYLENIDKIASEGVTELSALKKYLGEGDKSFLDFSDKNNYINKALEAVKSSLSTIISKMGSQEQYLSVISRQSSSDYRNGSSSPGDFIETDPGNDSEIDDSTLAPFLQTEDPFSLFDTSYEIEDDPGRTNPSSSGDTGFSDGSSYQPPSTSEDSSYQPPSTGEDLGFSDGSSYHPPSTSQDLGFSDGSSYRSSGIEFVFMTPTDDFDWFDDLVRSKYAKGTTSAKKGFAQVFEEGPEIITTSKGTFIPFKGGEGVVPAKQTEMLMRLANGVQNGMFELQMPNMDNYKPIESHADVVNNSEISIGSLITINGNVDNNTVDQIKQIASDLVRNKQFQENVTQFVSKRQAQDGKMAGRRISVK